MKAAFVGGALSFKGDKKEKKKKKKRKTKHSYSSKTGRAGDITLERSNNTNDGFDEDLTDAERKAQKKRLEQEQKEIESVAKKSHRDRIEEFNTKLGSLTEHNDIARVRMKI